MGIDYTYQLCSGEADGRRHGTIKATKMPLALKCTTSGVLPLRSDNSTIGFTDNVNYYVFNGSQVLVFSYELTSSETEKTMPYKFVDTSSVIVGGDPPGGVSGSSDSARDGGKSSKF